MQAVCVIAVECSLLLGGTFWMIRGMEWLQHRWLDWRGSRR